MIVDNSTLDPLALRPPRKIRKFWNASWIVCILLVGLVTFLIAPSGDPGAADAVDGGGGGGGGTHRQGTKRFSAFFEEEEA